MGAGGDVAEQLPEVVVAYGNQSALYYLLDGLVDINDFVNSAKWGLSEEEQADFFESFFTADVFPQYGNVRLGFPPNRSMEVMYYNIDWLEELRAAGAISFDGPPTTPEQFEEALARRPPTPSAVRPLTPPRLATNSAPMPRALPASRLPLVATFSTLRTTSTPSTAMPLWQP